MRLGYFRPPEATDLYKPQDDRSSGAIAKKMIRSFEEGQRKAAEYNSKLANGEISPGLKDIWWSIPVNGKSARGNGEKAEQEEGQSRDGCQSQCFSGVLVSSVSFTTLPRLPALCSSR